MLLEGKQVYVGPFQPKTERGSSEQKFTNVFLKNLDESTTEEDLRALCDKFGAITSCCVMTVGCHGVLFCVCDKVFLLLCVSLCVYVRVCV